MVEKTDLRGVICAVVTPFASDGRPDLDNLSEHLAGLATDGCDGVLLLGTTGEGPSLGVAERTAVIEAGLAARGPMRVLAGTGCANLPETIALTKRAFELGADAAVVVPPFYYKKVTVAGLSEYYRRLLDAAVPDDGLLMLYHIPQVTGVPISMELLDALVSTGDARIAGVKDSSGDIAHARELRQRFPDLQMFVGDDKLLLGGLEIGVAGSITAGANVLAPLGAAVYRTFRQGGEAAELQAQLTAARSVLDSYQPFPATMKMLLALRYETPGWCVRAPLMAMEENAREALLSALLATGVQERVSWLGTKGTA